jgi:hypothetical protein
MGRRAALCGVAAVVSVLVGTGQGCGFDGGGLGSGDDDGGGANADVTTDTYVRPDANNRVDAAPHDAAADSPPRDGTVDAPPEASGDGCASKQETCNNGVDDNCNGLVDCQDPECGSSASCTCVGAPPANWSQPQELWQGNGSPPACTTDFGNAVFDGNAGPVVDPGCSACACATSTATCTVGVHVNDNNGCGGGACLSDALTNGACKAIATCGSSTPHQQIDSPAPQNAACAPSGGALQSAGWSAAGRACSTAYTAMQGGCGAGQLSVPVPAAPFGSGLCIAASGAQVCTDPSYMVAHVYYSGISDSRQCTQCTCGGVSGDSCAAGSVVLYSDGNCGTSVQTDATGDSCANRIGFASMKLTGADYTGGTCSPIGGTEIGSAMPTGPTTYCCTQ